MCGGSWLAIKDSLTHRPSSQGWASKCPLCIYLYILVCMGGLVWIVFPFLFHSIYYWCAIHVYFHVCVKSQSVTEASFRLHVHVYICIVHVHVRVYMYMYDHVYVHVYRKGRNFRGA